MLTPCASFGARSMVRLPLLGSGRLKCGVVACLAAAASFSLTDSAEAVSSPAAVINVDFKKRVKVGNAVGFMHGGLDRLSSAVRARAEIRAAQLSPGIWRGVPQTWSMNPDTVARVGAEPVIQLGDLWGLPGHWPKVWPDQDLAAYSEWVETKALMIKQWFPTGTVSVDVWNEPDTARFWPVSRDPNLMGYFAAFRTAEHALRKVLGSRVRIIGPSTASRASAWTGRLVNYCAANGCKLDAIAWHANFNGTGLMDGLDSSMQRIRRKAGTDRTWKRVVRQPVRFLVTEYVSAGKRTDPGSLLAYWSQIERGGGGQAAFSVWREGDESDGVLDSLLDSDGQPRSGWWAARAYTIGRRSRVSTSSSSALWPALAARRGLSGKREVLLGSWGSRGAWVQVRLSGLPKGNLGLRLAAIKAPLSPWKGSAQGPSWRIARPIRSRGGIYLRRVWVPGDSVVVLAVG